MQKNEQDRSCWKILTFVKVNGQGSSQSQRIGQQLRVLTCSDVTLGLTWQDTIRGRCVWLVGVREARDGDDPGACERVVAHDRAWWCVECMLVRQKLQPAHGGMCEVVSSHSWLGFARDWLFCHSMPLLWQLDEQNDEIQELQGLWAWQRWLVSDSDY